VISLWGMEVRSQETRKPEWRYCRRSKWLTSSMEVINDAVSP
jgi:hypothetical protein